MDLESYDYGYIKYELSKCINSRTSILDTINQDKYHKINV